MSEITIALMHNPPAMVESIQATELSYTNKLHIVNHVSMVTIIGQINPGQICDRTKIRRIAAKKDDILCKIWQVFNSDTTNIGPIPNLTTGGERAAKTIQSTY
jgi:hypothetical protein